MRFFGRRTAGRELDTDTGRTANKEGNGKPLKSDMKGARETATILDIYKSDMRRRFRREGASVGWEFYGRLGEKMRIS